MGSKGSGNQMTVARDNVAYTEISSIGDRMLRKSLDERKSFWPPFLWHVCKNILIMYSKRPIYLGITFLHLGSAPVPASLPLARKPESQNVPARSNLAILHGKIDQKRAGKGSPSLIPVHNKKQCPDARSDLDQLQTQVDLGGGQTVTHGAREFKECALVYCFFRDFS